MPRKKIPELEISKDILANYIHGNFKLSKKNWNRLDLAIALIMAVTNDGFNNLDGFDLESLK